MRTMIGLIVAAVLIGVGVGCEKAISEAHDDSGGQIVATRGK